MMFYEKDSLSSIVDNVPGDILRFVVGNPVFLCLISGRKRYGQIHRFPGRKRLVPGGHALFGPAALFYRESGYDAPELWRRHDYAERNGVGKQRGSRRSRIIDELSVRPVQG